MIDITNGILNLAFNELFAEPLNSANIVIL
jgi:hypothetical protein